MYRFIGHEFFVTFFSFLIREGRWELIANLLDNDIPVRNKFVSQNGLSTFGDISEYLRLLDHRNARLSLQRVSLHSDILNARHTAGELSKIVPAEQFQDADYFLFLRGALPSLENDDRIKWRPWSALYLNGRVPIFLSESVRMKNAQRLIVPLGVESVDMLRARFVERAKQLRSMFRYAFGSFDPLNSFDPKTIGTR